MKLMSKYGVPKTNYPVNNDVKLNKDIKEVCRLCGINEIIKAKIATVVKIKGKSVTRNIIKEVYKYESITTRTFRRSFATNYYGKIDTSLIRAVTGHSTEKQLRAYINNEDETNIPRATRQIDDYHEQREKDKNSIKLTVIPRLTN